ncbi:MAG TPA: PfkB family carbohydrate kinase, partial [Flavobacteriales bacterium]|nr:PfkB family carbohydrate kinase [Flavobacteriales bacterium]
HILFSNEYESHMIQQKTGWSAQDVLDRVEFQVITLGANGVRVVGNNLETVEVGAVPGVAAKEPTGVGDAFRGGFLAALEWGLSHERAAQVGCVIAAYVVESVGTQEYSFTRQEFVQRVSDAYGANAAAEVQEHYR